MKKLTRLGALAEMPPPGELKRFDCSGEALCVANVKGDLRAMADACPHKGVSLSEGELHGKRVVCPKHEWAFHTKSGSCRHRSGYDAEVFALFGLGDDVFVQL